MKNTIIVTHGNFGIELLKSVEMIAGKQDDTVVFSINPGDDLSIVQAQLQKLVIENQITYIFVNIFGGTPFNFAATLMNEQVKIITGVNLPMLLEYYLSEKIDPDNLVDISKASIKYTNKELGTI